MDEWPAVGVVGGSGGVGASTLSAILALQAAPALLIDLDPVAGGIDVLLGAEAVPGPRWSGLRLGGGHLDPAVLIGGLPAWGPVTFLSSDLADLPPPVAVDQALSVARRAGPVVLDLARDPSPTRALAVARCALVVVVVGPGVRATTAARAVRQGLGSAAVGVLARGPNASRTAALVEAPLLGRLGDWDLDEPLTPASIPRGLARAARGVLDGVLP